MNANTTISTNDTNNMNTTGLNPVGNDILQLISGGGLSALQVVAASGDTYPPLKVAVVEALAIIGIIKKFKINKKDWAAFSATLIEKMAGIVQAIYQYNKSQILLTLQPNFDNLRCILDHLKEEVIKIQQQNPCKRFANFRKDQEYIADFQVKLNALPNFQVCLSIEEGSQEPSISSYKYSTWYYFLICTDVKRDVQEGPILTEPNKDDMSIVRRNVVEKPITTKNGTEKTSLKLVLGSIIIAKNPLRITPCYKK
ncbi:uncharacterized protein LACBIDRAFT_298369 [Laccaria bicolor S238N-H82]|uniref:Predicted protein n=1 Tax=Laccaria bicolor (strain S238N-H82 / ATCC MYA-4686) TaxID=486041 RepID=B0E3D3_LACBS|nr:uncharacterized protein LACBIDRAFT_298369 [Laccaria bicolor S238N-H82]EDQ98654.1 predicted protein [Laccaria bicolor S238N-H82]|eukprot:XP_001890701.1 predicted protein [Laccaria bicolor S238N-H82]